MTQRDPHDIERVPEAPTDWYASLPVTIGGLVVFGLIIWLFLLPMARGRDLGQWENSDPDVRAWYEGLMQPDVPTASCCGAADAYWCDSYGADPDGHAHCTISDDRPDEPRGRPHVDIGTVIQIPDNKLKWDRGNPTGHGVVFLSRGGYVFCFVQPGGA